MWEGKPFAPIRRYQTEGGETSAVPPLQRQESVLHGPWALRLRSVGGDFEREQSAAKETPVSGIRFLHGSEAMRP